MTFKLLLLRLAGASAAEKAAYVVQAIQQHGNELAGAFAVLDASQLRIRRVGA